MIAEQFIDGIELTAAILGGEALPLIRLETPRDFYDYEAKYFADDTRYILPVRPAARGGAGDPGRRRCARSTRSAAAAGAAST